MNVLPKKMLKISCLNILSINGIHPDCSGFCFHAFDVFVVSMRRDSKRNGHESQKAKNKDDNDSEYDKRCIAEIKPFHSRYYTLVQ